MARKTPQEPTSFLHLQGPPCNRRREQDPIPQPSVLLPRGCHSEQPQRGGFQEQNVFCHGSGSQCVSGAGSFWGSEGVCPVPPSQLRRWLAILGVAWPGCASLRSLPPPSRGLPRVSSRGLPRVSPRGLPHESPRGLLRRHHSLDQGPPYSRMSSSELIISLLPNKVTF